MTEMEILLEKTVGNNVARGRINYNCILYCLCKGLGLVFIPSSFTSFWFLLQFRILEYVNTIKSTSLISREQIMCDYSHVLEYNVTSQEQSFYSRPFLR